MKTESLVPLFESQKVPQDARKIIETFDDILQNVRPLNSRQLQQLPDNIRTLSHQLTDDRASRRLGYMNDTIQLISYVRYYTWWNLVRLTRLFSNLPEESFPSSAATCLDLGTGPLTVIAALWLARPELRKLPLSWYCLDVSANSMILGEDIYLSIVAKTGGEAWKITRVKGSFGTGIRQKADFITCANMFNELDQNSDMPPEFRVKKYFSQLNSYGSENARYLLIEPGVPKASRTLSLLRERFIKSGSMIASPCPHHLECPMNGFKAYTGSKHKWCNFAFSTEDAPSRLQKLSERAKLPKERATLSFISVIPTNSTPKESLQKDFSVRITSDKIRLPNYMCGYYGCSEQGLVLVTLPDENNTRLQKAPFRPQSGDLILFATTATETAKPLRPSKADTALSPANASPARNRKNSGKPNNLNTKKRPDFPAAQKRDEKSGALIIEL